MKNYHALLILISALLITYGAIWITPYVFTDDYPTYVQKLNNNLWEDSKRGIIAVGRPIYAIFLYLGFTAINSIDDLRFLRLIGIIGVAVTSWIMYITLKKRGWSTTTSLCISFIVGTLPAFEVYTSWSITYIFPWACVLAGLSAYVLAMSWNKYIRWATSAMLLILSFNVYQPAATIFWVYAAIHILGKQDEKIEGVIRRFFQYLCIFAAAAISSLIIQKVIVKILGEKYANTRTGLTTDILAKIKWFIQKPLVDSTNLHNIQPSKIVAVLAIIIIIVGLWSYFKGSTKNKIWFIVISLAILPISYAPNLVASESWSGYRTQVGLESLVLIYLLFSIWGIIQNIQRSNKVAASILFVATSISAMWSMYNVTLGFVVPQYQELSSIRLQIDENKLDQTKKIYIIPAQWNQGTAPFLAYDEFGFPSSAAEWVPKNSLYIVLERINPKYLTIPTELLKDPKGKTFADSDMIIDMRKNENIRKLYFK